MVIRFWCVSSRAFGRSITSRGGSLIDWIEGTNGFVERISTAWPSFSCTIRKLLIAALFFTALAALTTEEAAGLESGLTAGLTAVWERSHGAPATSTPTAITAHKLARKHQRDNGCRDARFGGKAFTPALECFGKHTTRGFLKKTHTITNRPGTRNHQRRPPPPSC